MALQHRNTRDEQMIFFAERYNQNLKLLARDLIKRYPNDPKIYRAEKRVMFIIAVEPLAVIECSGPYLYQYREQIYDTDNMTSFFLQAEFDRDLNASVDTEKADMAAYIIPKAKECMRTLDPETLEVYKELVINLLDDYIEYVDKKRS